MLEKLFPKEVGFFDLMEKHAVETLNGARTFQSMLQEMPEISGKVKRIEEIEHECDSIVHMTEELLHKTFITPIDRDDIHLLVYNLDNVMDSVNTCAERIQLFEIRDVFKESSELAKVLCAAMEEVKKGVFLLRNVRKTGPEILKACVEVHRLENEGDGLFQHGIARLFKADSDPLYVMKWKDILETMEKSIDRCEDIADTLNGIVIENQ